MLRAIPWAHLPRCLAYLANECLHSQQGVHNSFSRCFAAQSVDVAGAFQRAITPAVAGHLAAQGYAVVDGVFGADVASDLRGEVARLYEQQLMHKNCTHLVKDNATQLLEKAHIHEAELTLDASIQAAAPLCSSLHRDRSLATLLSLFLPQLTLDSQAIKLQYNSGAGGCFPMHFDSDEHLDGRRVTAIFYLNPGWQPSHGGELRLYPFPCRPPLDIAPLHDRLVIFASTRMLHRVMPSANPNGRCCFTIWLSHNRRRAFVRQPPSLSSLEPTGDAAHEPHAVLRFLMHPDVRKHVCKHAYAQEWADSLEQSHPDSQERAAIVEQHWKEVGIIRRSLAKYLPLVDELVAATKDAGAAGGAAAQRTAPSVQWL